MAASKGYLGARGLIGFFLVASIGLSWVTAAASFERTHVAAINPVSSVSPQSGSAQASFFTINQVLALHDHGTGAGRLVRLASLDPRETLTDASVPSVRQPPQRAEPFGMLTFRAPEGLLWKKWRKLETELRADARIISACRAVPDECPSHAAYRLLTFVNNARNMSPRAGIASINRSINVAIRYVSDLRQHGLPDLWSASLDTFTSGQGDCEDYAIAKYVALRELGVDADDLRLLLVRDRAVGQDHAVLSVRQGGRWLILDNRHPDLFETLDVPQFTPLFSIDENGVKLFAASYAGHRLPSEVEVAPAPSGDYW